MNRRNLFLTGLVGAGAAGLGALRPLHADTEAEERLSAMQGMRFHEDPDPSNPLPPQTREHLNRYVQTGTMIPNLDLVTHDGKAVRFYDDCVKGKKVLINFMYTHCRGKCPLVHRNLLRVQDLLGERLGTEFFFYSITLEPEADTPEVLTAYRERTGVKPGWIFLTGKHEDTELLRRALGFVDPDPVLDADRTNHAGVVLYGNESRHRWAACPGQQEASEIVYYLSRLSGSVRRRSLPTAPILEADQGT